MSYGPMSYGSRAGEPVVDLPLSKDDDNAVKVQSLERMFDGWGWKRKLSSGFARLRFSGNDVLGGYHDEGMEHFSRLLSVRFVDVEVGKDDIHSKPSRDIKNKVNRYSVFVPLDQSFDEQTFQWFSDQSQSFGNVEFLFKVKTESDEDDIYDIVREYNIYDDDVWLYPAGRKVGTTQDRMQKAVKIGKRNSWNVSPRMGIILNAETDDE